MGAIGHAPSQTGDGDVIAVAHAEVVFREPQKKGHRIVIGGAIRGGFHQDLTVGHTVGQKWAVEADSKVHLIESPLTAVACSDQNVLAHSRWASLIGDANSAMGTEPDGHGSGGGIGEAF